MGVFDGSQILSALQNCELCGSIHGQLGAGACSRRHISFENLSGATNVAAAQHTVETLIKLGPRQFEIVSIEGPLQRHTGISRSGDFQRLYILCNSNKGGVISLPMGGAFSP